MKKKEMIELQKLLTRLKSKLTIEYKNNMYQDWAKGDRKLRFQDYVINDLKDYIYRNFENKQMEK